MLKESTPDEVKQAMEHLLHVAKKHGAHVAGYVWGLDDPPFIARVANVEPKSFDAALKTLMKLSNEQIAKGLVVNNLVKDVA